MRPLRSAHAKRFFESSRNVLHGAIIDCASLLVPAAQRPDWQREWQAELWHVRQACAPADGVAWRREAEVTAFCLGAFNDALCLAKSSRRLGMPFANIKGTPKQCIALLSLALCGTYAIALLLPGVQAERTLWPRTTGSDLVAIERAEEDADTQPTIYPEQYKTWQSRKQKFFDAFTFYRVKQAVASFDADARDTRSPQLLNVGLAPSNFLTVLGLPLMFTQSDEKILSPQPEVILSERVWKRNYGAGSHIAGRLVLLNGTITRIAGVVPDGALGLQGKVDVWQLDPHFNLTPNAAGYLVAHLTPLGRDAMWANRILITAPGPHDTEEDLLGVSLGDWQPSPQTIFLFGLMLALLCLPAITSVSLSERSVNPRKTSWTGKLAASAFLAAKVAFLLPIAYFVSLELAYGSTALGREHAVYIQLVCTFAVCLFGMQWVLRDQRQRCPVCLSLVVHPAQVGQASRTFLDWNGTEMMCSDGHTLLHVPALPTSWFSTQRWLYLDTSWDFLFVAPTRPTP